MAGSFKTVGSFGPVFRDDWSGEEAEIRADAALAFGAESDKRLASLARDEGKSAKPKTAKKRIFRQRNWPEVALDIGFSVVQRRLLADGDGHVRLELILRYDLGSAAPLDDRLEAILTSSTYVVREGRADLIDAGFRVARLYLAQSAKTADRPTEAVATQ